MTMVSYYNTLAMFNPHHHHQGRPGPPPPPPAITAGGTSTAASSLYPGGGSAGGYNSAVVASAYGGNTTAAYTPHHLHHHPDQNSNQLQLYANMSQFDFGGHSHAAAAAAAWAHSSTWPGFTTPTCRGGGGYDWEPHVVQTPAASVLSSVAALSSSSSATATTATSTTSEAAASSSAQQLSPNAPAITSSPPYTSPPAAEDPLARNVVATATTLSPAPSDPLMIAQQHPHLHQLHHHHQQQQHHHQLQHPGGGAPLFHGHHHHNLGPYRAITPPQYKLEPPSSTTSELVGCQLGEGDEDEEEGDDDCCPSPDGSLPPSRPGPARSPYEWMKKPSYQSPNSSADPNARTRTKDKYRIVYSDHQRLELEKEFHYSRYITIRRKAELANCIGLSERQVKIWFQNRRAKERRSLKKQEDVLVKEKLECTFSPPGGHMGGMEGPHPFSTASLMPPLPQHFSQCLSTSSFPTFMKFE